MQHVHVPKFKAGVVVAFKKKTRNEEESSAEGSVSVVTVGKRTDGQDRLEVFPTLKLLQVPAVTRTAAGCVPERPDTPAAEGRQIRLGEQLIGSHLITEEQLEQALAMQRDAGGRLGEVLVSLGALTEQSLAHALAAFFGYEVANLRRDVINPNIVTLISEDVARENMAFPVRLQDDGVLSVAVAEPSDELRNALARASGKTVQLVIAPLGDIRWAIDIELSRAWQCRQIGQGVRVRRRVSRRRARIARAQRSSPTTRRSSRWSTASSLKRCATAPRTCTSSPVRRYRPRPISH